MASSSAAIQSSTASRRQIQPLDDKYLYRAKTISEDLVQIDLFPTNTDGEKKTHSVHTCTDESAQTSNAHFHNEVATGVEQKGKKTSLLPKEGSKDDSFLEMKKYVATPSSDEDVIRRLKTVSCDELQGCGRESVTLALLQMKQKWYYNC